MKNKTISTFLLIFAAIVVVNLAGAATANAQYGRDEPRRVFLLDIDGIEGGFQEKGFEKQISVSSWSTGASYDVDEATGNFQSLYISMTKSRASAGVFQAMVAKKIIPKVVFTVVEFPADRKSPPLTIFKMTLRDVQISSFQMGGSEGSGELSEQVSFEYKSGIYEGAGEDAGKGGNVPKIEFTVPPKKPKSKDGTQ